MSMDNSVEEDKQGTFVQLTNNLKSNIRDNNATPSYLLALSQYDDINEENDEVDSICQEKVKKDIRHIRLPSVYKNLKLGEKLSYQ